MSLEENNPEQEGPKSGEESQVGGNLESTLAAFDGLPGGESFNNELSELRQRSNNSPEGDNGEQGLGENKGITNPDDTQAVANDLLANSSNPEVVDSEEPNNPDGGTPPESGDTESGNENPAEEQGGYTLDSPMFGGKTKIGKNKPEEGKPFEFDGADKANEFIKEKTGFENLDALVNSSLEAKQKLDSFEDTEKKVSEYENLFREMPPELYQGVEAFIKGEDWKTPIISKPNLDFTKDVESHDDRALVDNYLPGQFTDAEWENYNEGGEEQDPGVKKAIDIALGQAKNQYNNDKTGLDNFQSNKVVEAENRVKVFNESVDKSIGHLKGSIENIDEGYITEIKNSLTPQGLTEIFFNKDGSIKEDAALKVAMAKNGYDLFNQYKGIAEHQAENKERQDILDRTPSTPKAKKSSEEVSKKVRPEVAEYIKTMTSGLDGNSVY